MGETFGGAYFAEYAMPFVAPTFTPGPSLSAGAPHIYTFPQMSPNENIPSRRTAHIGAAQWWE